MLDKINYMVNYNLIVDQIMKQTNILEGRGGTLTKPLMKNSHLNDHTENLMKDQLYRIETSSSTGSIAEDVANLPGSNSGGAVFNRPTRVSLDTERDKYVRVQLKYLNIFILLILILVGMNIFAVAKWENHTDFESWIEQMIVQAILSLILLTINSGRILYKSASIGSFCIEFLIVAFLVLSQIRLFSPLPQSSIYQLIILARITLLIYCAIYTMWHLVTFYNTLVYNRLITLLKKSYQNLPNERLVNVLDNIYKKDMVYVLVTILFYRIQIKKVFKYIEDQCNEAETGTENSAIFDGQAV